MARPYIGGQALIEGVMMRSPHSYAAVVRRRSGALMAREQEMKDPRKGVRAWPFVRGMVTRAVEERCRKAGIARVTIEELERIRSKMPTPKLFSK